MFFISRYVYPDKVGVVDTDDNVEEIYSYKELMYLQKAFRGEIAGLKVNHVTGILDDIRPWQSPRTITRGQLKLKMASDIEITVFDNAITSIRFDRPQSTAIRLSDFGASCADCILRGCLPPGDDSCVTLVFDDRIRVSYTSFKSCAIDGRLKFGFPDIGVRYDLRECNVGRTLVSVYKAMYNEYKMNMWQSIIDRPERVMRINNGYYGRQ